MNKVSEEDLRSINDGTAEKTGTGAVVNGSCFVVHHCRSGKFVVGVMSTEENWYYAERYIDEAEIENYVLNYQKTMQTRKGESKVS